MISKKLIFPALIIVAAGGIVAIKPLTTLAQTTTPLSGLVEMIAQKFNLDQNQVQVAIDEYRSKQKQNFEDGRLSKLVTQGKITEAQKQVIITELATLKTKYGSDKSQYTNLQNDWKTWAQASGIDPTLIMPRFGMGFRGRMHKFNISPTPTI
jgi:phenylpyruvate tautomerase PptA (4-oxalocrotonate tautomerase family)